MQAEFLPDKDWFKGKKLRLDSAFQGIEEVYETMYAVLPQKKPKNKPMPEETKELNRQKSQKRVIVEHAIAGLKRFRILSDRFRIHDFNLYDEILGICAALWNLNLA